MHEQHEAKGYELTPMEQGRIHLDSRMKFRVSVCIGVCDKCCIRTKQNTLPSFLPRFVFQVHTVWREGIRRANHSKNS